MSHQYENKSGNKDGNKDGDEGENKDMIENGHSNQNKVTYIIKLFHVQ